MFSFTNSQEKYRFNHCFLFYIRITAGRLSENQAHDFGKTHYACFQKALHCYCCPPFNEATFTAPFSRLVNIPS